MLSFVREVPISLTIQGALSSRRGFLFRVAAGFHAPIDPLSGMSVNLVLVDQWLGELQSYMQGQEWSTETESINEVFFRLLQSAKTFLTEKAQGHALLQSLQFQEERQWGFSWDATLSREEMRMFYGHYLESIPKQGKFELCHIVFTWLGIKYAKTEFPHEDLQHEGFKILKDIAQSDSEDLLVSLKKRLKEKVSEQVFLEKVRVDFLTSQYSVEL